MKCPIFFGILIPSLLFISVGVTLNTESLPKKDIIINSAGIKMKLIEGGEFMMGSETDEREKPIHNVRITKAYYIGIYEVTRKQFAEFIKATNYETEAEVGDGAKVLKNGEWKKEQGASWKNPGFKQGDDDPVVCVSWNDTMRFCEWLSKKEGVKYRLPTEAEWEYACRAGTATKYYWGDKFDPKYAWTVENANGKTHKVGTREPNGWGLYDMSANVSEWCMDWWEEKYQADGKTDPQGPPDGFCRLLRGGSWYNDQEACRSAARGAVIPTTRYSAIGFRICCSSSER